MIQVNVVHFDKNYLNNKTLIFTDFFHLKKHVKMLLIFFFPIFISKKFYTNFFFKVAALKL